VLAVAVFLATIRCCWRGVRGAPKYRNGEGCDGWWRGWGGMLREKTDSEIVMASVAKVSLCVESPVSVRDCR
jgi:hypothetical protein